MAKTEKNIETEATAESILALRGKVPVEELNIAGIGKVWIYGFTALEKAEWQKEVRDKKNDTVDSKIVEPLMFQMCVRDSKGNKLFQYRDIPKIRELPSCILSSVCDVCMKLSGMGQFSDDAILKNLSEEAEEQDTDAS